MSNCGAILLGIEYSPMHAESAWQRIVEGPVRVGKTLGQSTAIFKPRRKRAPQEETQQV